MDQYSVSGRFRTREGWQPFEKRVEAENEDVAVEHVYAAFGSQHNLKRTQVDISEVSA
jgi:large subunit ribosomal protein LX